MHVYRVETAEGPQLVQKAGAVLLPLAAPGVPLQDTLRPGYEPVAARVIATGAILAPLIPGKIIAVGLNYLDHVREAGVQAPEEPLLFAKFPSTVIGDGAAIEYDPEVAHRVDWETELAVVIGSAARDVSVESALDHVYGYTVANDVSARDLQFRDGQWIRGKNLDTFCPLGPGIVTADEIANPNDLVIRTRVNGRVVQDSSTSQMIFSVAAIISYCSIHFTLNPGDVILTGTPWGCGEFADPPVHLTEGDTVSSEIVGVGILTNPVRHRAPSLIGDLA